MEITILKSEILETLAHDHFVSLENRGNKWTCVYLANGERVEQSDKWLERLLHKVGTAIGVIIE